MRVTNNFIFTSLKIIGWIIFVGLCIETGGLIVNFIFTIYKPEFIPKLYQKLDLSEMYNNVSWAFFSMYGFVLVISILKSVMFYKVILLLTNLNLAKPFNSIVSENILQISYITLSIGLFSYVARQITKNLLHHGIKTDNLNPFWEDSQAFVLMSAVIYVIAFIFQRGVQLQNENDLTV